MQFLDPSLVAELSAAVLGVTQAIKNKKRLRGIDGEVIAIAVGLCVGVVWFVARGDIIDPSSWGGVNWKEMFQGAINGILGGIAASTGFNIQKYLPVPNVLPTRQEKDALLTTTNEAQPVSEDVYVDESESLDTNQGEGPVG